MVCPTISGITVDRRDQVLTTFFSLARFIDSIFSSSDVSTNGPFFSDLLLTLILASDPPGLKPGLLGPSLDDELIRVLATARLVALRRLAPRRHRVTATRGLAFTT